MDKSKVFRLVLIPIVAGLIVTLIVQRFMTVSEQATSAPQVEMVSVVLVATKEPIPARTKLSETQFIVKQIPKEMAAGTEFAEISEVAGQINTVDLQPGEVVLRQRVVPEGQGALPYRIPEGMRAVTIRMDELNGVGGYPNEGDLVDLILFLPEKKVDKPVEFTFPASSRILHEAVLVLAKGPYTSDGAKPKTEGAPLTSITLALTPQQATEVVLAEQVGYIKMLLRPALKQPDTGKYQTDEAKYRNNPWVMTVPADPSTPNR